MNEVLTRSIVVQDRTITYQLERKNVKNLNLRVRKDGSVYVSAHAAVSTEEIDKFVAEKSAYVLAAVDRIQQLSQCKAQPKRYVSGETFNLLGRGLRLQVLQAEKETVSSDGVYIYLSVKDCGNLEKRQKLLSRYFDKQCREVFSEIVEGVYPVFEKYGVKKPLLRMRSMETRWGSCLPSKGIITLNKRLIEAPKDCIEYVVMHEFCHFIHPNHSKRFHIFLSMLMPDWKKRKTRLDKQADYWL